MTFLQKHHGQMSDSMLTAFFIILSGGLQDAYTYCCRGKVFANAQTGNIVLLSTHLFEGDWGQALRYLVPVLAFLLGIYIAECVHRHFKRMEKVHWRQLIILAEIDHAANLCPCFSAPQAAGGAEHLFSSHLRWGLCAVRNSVRQRKSRCAARRGGAGFLNDDDLRKSYAVRATEYPKNGRCAIRAPAAFRSIAAGDLGAVAELAGGAVRQLDAHLGEDIHGEAGAVEAAGRGTAVDVGHAQILLGNGDDAAAGGGGGRRCRGLGRCFSRCFGGRPFGRCILGGLVRRAGQGGGGADRSSAREQSWPRRYPGRGWDAPSPAGTAGTPAHGPG